MAKFTIEKKILTNCLKAALNFTTKQPDAILVEMYHGGIQLTGAHPEYVSGITIGVPREKLTRYKRELGKSTNPETITIENDNVNDIITFCKIKKTESLEIKITDKSIIMTDEKLKKTLKHGNDNQSARSLGPQVQEMIKRQEEKLTQMGTIPAEMLRYYVTETYHACSKNSATHNPVKIIKEAKTKKYELYARLNQDEMTCDMHNDIENATTEDITAKMHIGELGTAIGKITKLGDPIRILGGSDMPIIFASGSTTSKEPFQTKEVSFWYVLAPMMSGDDD